MLRLTASPPLTVFSVITYLTPASTSNNTPSKTSSITDRSPLAPVPRSKAILAISLTAASVNTKSAPWNLTSFLNCLINDLFVSLKNRGKVFDAKSIQGRYHRQPPDHLGDQPVCFQVFWLHLPEQPISRHLAVFSHLTEPKPTPPKPLGDDLLQTHERPTADEQDVGRVEGNARLHRVLVAALRRHRGDRAFQHLQEGVLDALPQILEAEPLRWILSISSM